MSVEVIILATSFLFAALATAVMTPVMGRVAARLGLVSPPRADRWGSRATPLLGGVVIVLSIVVCSIALVDDYWPFVAVVTATLAAFLLGLIDDVRGLRPTSKLAGQVIIGSGLALAGVRVEIIPALPLAFLATLVWVVLIMNAVNLMDNMDGLAAGVVAIAASVLVVMASASAPWIVITSAATAGACVGFLVHNFAPARIYMGDAGSMALGALLASLTLLQTNQEASNVGLAVLAPLVALGLPIFDTVLVTVVRRLEGRPVSQGGRDHTSHRLAALGLSERVTVLILYAVAGAMAGLGLLASAFGLAFVPIAGLTLVALVLFAIFLMENPVAAVLEGVPARASVLGGGRLFVRYGGEIALDVTLAMVALLSAYLIRFESFGTAVSLPLFISALPIVIPVQLGAFVLLGLYRILWRYLSVVDMFVIMRATFAGTVAAAGIVLSTQVGQSRAVFLIDGVLLSLLVAGSRMFLVSLRHWFGMQGRASGRRVLIVGANETGAMALRLLLRSADPRYRPTGFLDDDPGKQRRRIAGISVLGRVKDLPAVVRREGAEVVVLALEDHFEREQAVRLQCEELGLELRQLAPKL
jgi:UDP-GlcNAc:undecaprenyl-phosphate/decaprenyl-phosphate GlcNAc-1-phosphate transferase